MQRQQQRQPPRPTSGAQRPETAVWGDFLDREWSHWCTLTGHATDRGSYTEGALRADLGRFIRRLEATAQTRMRFAGAVQGVEQGHPHAHLLLDAHGLTDARIKRAWKAGLADVQPYDRQQGARFYTTRLVGADPDSLLISENLPPRLHPEPAEPHTVADSDIQGENAAVLTLLRGDQKTTVKTPDTSLPTVRVSSVEVVDLQGWAALMARIIMDRAQHRAGAA